MELMKMNEKTEIEIKPHVYEQIQHDLEKRNKELSGNKKLDMSQYINLLLERECVKREYDELENKLYYLAGKLQALENSIEGKRAKSLFTIDDVTQIKQSGK